MLHIVTHKKTTVWVLIAFSRDFRYTVRQRLTHRGLLGYQYRKTKELCIWDVFFSMDNKFFYIYE